MVLPAAPATPQRCRSSIGARIGVLGVALVAVAAAGMSATAVRAAGETSKPAGGRIAAGGVLRINVPEAFGGKTVIGQLTVDQAIGAGYVTAYGCADGPPVDQLGDIARSDLNFNSEVSPVASNRLVVKADDAGDVCLFTSRPAALVVDINGVTFDTGISSFANRRTDTRTGSRPVLPAGGVLRVNVPEAAGGATVVGQLTVDRVDGAGYVTAYGCDGGIPMNRRGEVSRSDLNYDSRVSPVASNRLIVQADADGDVCLFTLRPAALIVDLNGVADTGITSFANQRTDTRASSAPVLAARGVLKVTVPAAVGGATVLGQLSVDRVDGAGYVTAYGCADGLPMDADGLVARSDLNYDGAVSPVASNRLIVRADANGEVCFYTLRPAALVIDVNGVTDVGISSFRNRRTDTRSGTLPGDTAGPTIVDGVPVWPPYQPLPPTPGVAALTGLSASSMITNRPILAVKIDNYSLARPQWGLDRADAVFEENVEGVTRFVALFHSDLPDVVGPVRSARTGDLDLLSAMNRPVFAYSGANDGVTSWIGSAAGARLLIDFSAQHSGCYGRSAVKPGPHNLVLDPACALGLVTDAGPARPLWSIDPAWTPPAGVVAIPDTAFRVPMDGVLVEWAWDPGSDVYVRAQDGALHLAESGGRIGAANVVEVASVHVPSPVDARSPNPITVGTGAAIVHRDGMSFPAVWSRANAYDPFEFFETATGTSIPLDSGATFIELTRAP